MQRYLISYEFTDGEDQEEGAEMLINWYESGGLKTDLKTMRFILGFLWFKMGLDTLSLVQIPLRQFGSNGIPGEG